MKKNEFALVGQQRQRGISLIIVMIMVVIIGITSASAIRKATSGERATNNIRMQNLAQQFAESALRYCEAELAKASATRVATLVDANILEKAYDAPTGWEQSTTWIVDAAVPGDSSASRTVIPKAWITSAISSVQPTTLPQCAVEKQVLADGKKALVVTARGFSPDYSFNTATGATKSGSVIWLQSILLL